MGSNYFNRPKAKVKNRDTGYQNKLYVASKDDFTLIAEPTSPFTAPGDELIITDDHTFETGNGFVELLTSMDSNDAPGESAGDIGSKKTIWSPAGFIPGDGPDVQSMIAEMHNDDLILLMQDANCPDGPMIQWGCDCKTARLDTAAFTSGTTATDGRKGYLLTFKASCRYFYEGTVTLQT